MKSPNEPGPRRGWVYMADLDPPRGTEPGKFRPVLALQTDLLNSRHPSMIVVPLTTKVALSASILRVHFKKGEASLGADSDAMVDQLRAIDNRQLGRALGAAPAARMAEVERALSILLDLPGA
ncbi:MAG: type II toxin-antitoxin system PemK/MazF family toxin [Elusimicrobia bacterium]|nr:type II toxin-antitoxin system PemK/MazF family toxin [Elusimicrobiota bacterium]MDE2512450.1 type II toxin-antitoxin system PemK/MazF family toxin [Elusimicrobiota bacterium]